MTPPYEATAKTRNSPALTAAPTASRRALVPRLADAAPLVAAWLWLAFTLGARPLAMPDEGRYVSVAWAMVTSGDWAVPVLNGLPYFHKPPLFYWITAASLWVFGPSEWAARLAPLLGAGLGATALYLFAMRWCGARIARMGLLVLATQPLVFVGAQFANLDMLVAGCIGASTLAFAHALLVAEGGGGSRLALAAGYAFAALGVLAKGMIGVVLPGLVIVAWVAVRRRPRLLRALPWAPGIALFALVAAPWFIAMQLRFADFAHYFFVVQHFTRYAQGGFNNVQPWWFFPAVLAVLGLPWSAWLPAAFLAGRRAGEDAQHPVHPVRALAWLWLVLVTMFFSLPRSKLVGYILPVAWPMAWLVAERALAARDASWRGRRLVAASVAAGGLAGVLAVAYVAVHPLRSSRDLGLALASRIGPGDAVAFIEGAYFDVPFYAGLRRPVWIVDDWRSDEVLRRDNWRKELADAGRFAPEQARSLLLTPEAFAAASCGGATVWVLAMDDARSRVPALQAAERVASQEGRSLWRLPAPTGFSRPDCAETPSANSAGKS